MTTHLIAALLATSAPVAVPMTAPAPTVASPQALFDAASQAVDDGRYEDAVTGFTAIEQRPGGLKSAVVRSTLLMRKGRALLALHRDAEAVAALTEGLRLAPDSRRDLHNDRYLATRALGMRDLTRLNYASAAEHFKAALLLADDPGTRIDAYLALATATTFDPGTDAIGYVDQAIALAPQPSKPTKEQKKNAAAMQTLRARILLNQGRFTEAFDTLKNAVTAQGGLDLTVSISEVVTRSDLAIAALLAGREEDARKYLAFTGAGLLKSPFDRAVSMSPPPCGGPADLRPDDVAVVEFAIQPDGTTGSPIPIYVSRKGPAAMAFAGAVANWSWRPEAVAKIPEFFRLVTRVELRCSTSAERPSALNLLETELNNWFLAAKLSVPQLSGVAGSDLAPLKAELARRRSRGNAADLIPVLLALGESPVVPLDQAIAAITEARDLATAHRAPLAARTMIEISLAKRDAVDRDYSSSRLRSAYRALLTRPGVADDALVADTLKLSISDPIWRSPFSPDAATLLGEVSTDARLDPKHPLRIAALIRLATLQAEAGNLAAAAENYRQTGLSVQQCALIEAKPALLKTNSGGSDFPTEALLWGFEGWVRIEYDIMADGKTAAQRAIVAYPPFVFRDAADKLAKGLRYSRTYRPDGTAGCGGAQENVRFGIPSRH